MKARPCKFPFNNFVGYKQTHPSGRTYIYMWDRTTDRRRLISLARYRMSVKLQRFLSKEEEVDHRDEDRTNDSISNLQLLSGAANKAKNTLHRNGIVWSHTKQKCSVCNSTIIAPRKRQVCSPECRHILIKDGRCSHPKR